MKFTKLFNKLTGFDPLPFQERLIDFTKTPTGVLKAPTGSGKTEYYVANWVYDRLTKPQDTPRRLIIQLPMRTLVTQTTARVKAMLARAGLDIPVYTIQGGQLEEDFIFEFWKEAVVVGTQDQILSGQLMRKYCSSPKAAPLHFNALNNDVRIVADEIQLMTVGYSTSVKIQEFFEEAPGFHRRELLVCSATLNDKPLRGKHLTTIEVNEDDFNHPFFSKKLKRRKELHLHDEMEPLPLGHLVSELHEPGTLSLVVCNKVARAQEVMRSITGTETLLLTSRFRRAERQQIEEQLKSFKGVIVATQTIEAGVDLDARRLFTDLCPGSSIVQRAGRGGRNGTYEECDVHVINNSDSRPLPYERRDLDQAWAYLQDLKDRGLDISLHTLLNNPIVEDITISPLGPTKFQELCRNQKGAPNIPVAPYVREVDDGNVFVCWRENPSVHNRLVEKTEICPTYWNQVRQAFSEVWVFDDFVNKKPVWKKVTLNANSLPPQNGVVIVDSQSGRYDPVLGWDPQSLAPVPEIPPSGDKAYEDWGRSEALSLRVHLKETGLEEAPFICEELGLDPVFTSICSRAGFLHDVGKAMPVWQDYIQKGDIQPGVLLAKSDADVGTLRRIEIPCFRHEVASALYCLATGEDSAVTYLVMAHHGQVRAVYDSASDPNSDFVEEEGRKRGVKNGDVLPLIAGVTMSDVTLHHPEDYGLTWSGIYNDLVDAIGVFQLVELECIVRASDIRSSQRHLKV